MISFDTLTSIKREKKVRESGEKRIEKASIKKEKRHVILSDTATEYS